MFRFPNSLSLCFCAGVILAVPGSPLRADDVLPKAPPASKYAKMAGHSPFAPPTVPVAAQASPVAPPAPGWADGLKATMIAQDGTNYMVTVEDAQNPLQHLYLTAEPDEKTQMAVVSVKWGVTRDDPPTITLSKGKEFAQVRYEATTGTGAANAMGGGVPQIPGMAKNISGGQAFHAPFQAAATQPPNQGGPSSSMIRRPLIHAQQPAAPASVRPGVNAPRAAGVRPNAALQLDDDDDD